LAIPATAEQAAARPVFWHPHYAGPGQVLWLGGVSLIEDADRVLPREPAPLGEALGEALRRDGIELMLGMHAAAARRDGDDYVLAFDGGAELPPAKPMDAQMASLS
jgi:hypothetical protein